jgi:acetoacetyl-CoA synthetase
MAAGELLWTPPTDAARTSRIGDFMAFVEARHGLSLEGEYTRLWDWSVSDVSAFWTAVWDYFDVACHPPPEETLADTQLPGARWFPGARLNYAENVLRMPGLRDDDLAVLSYSQSRATQALTAGTLREHVRRVRAGLRRLGVGPGDRVAAYLPNIGETYALMLATASLGAVFSSCAPEFGTRSVVDRWRQIEPLVLVAVDGYRYGDKAIDRTDEVAQIRAALPSLRHVLNLPYLDPQSRDDFGELLLARTDEPLAFEPVPFDQPLYVLYSSGTTGLPKPIVHGHGGILLEHLKMLALHSDLGPGDRFFWFTTTGWMMWNFLVSAPAVGAAVVMFDGDPGSPDLGALWRLAEESGVTYFGTSAPFLLACRKAGIVPKEIANLTSIRGIGSTGAPLPPEGFSWVYEAVSESAQLQSISGGTDVCTAFVGSAPLLPVHAGEIACRCLAAKVEAYDPTGRPVIGEVGELVITVPMPSMPTGFWNDPDGSRLREAYFDVYPGVWRHGDWITISESGSCVITGRSDATLNRGGVRLGTSEFYSVVEGLNEVVDSVVVHLEDASGGPGDLLLFVVLAAGASLDDALRKKINGQLRAALSPRHIPDEIHHVDAVPRTLSGKKLEVPVKRILQGTPADVAAAKGALANPDSLTAFESLAALRTPASSA